MLGENIGVWGYNGRGSSAWKTLAAGATVDIGYKVDSGFFVLQCYQNGGMCIGWFASYNTPQVTFLANFASGPIGSTKDSQNVNLYIGPNTCLTLQNHKNVELKYRIVVLGLTNNWL